MPAWQRTQRRAVAGELHIAGAWIPAVAQGEVVQAVAARREGTVRSPGAGEVDGALRHAVRPKPPGSADHHLELVRLMVVRAHHRIGVLLHQERHRVDCPWAGRRFVTARVAIRPDICGQPEVGAIRAGPPASRARSLGRGNYRHPFPQKQRDPKITAMSEQDILAAIRFDAAGLVPAIAQQHDTGEVLMLAWMNREAVAETLAKQRVCYFSRSRNTLWRKGETSGQVQHLKELRVDCDGDTLLLLVDQEGVACHTGRRNCFFRAARGGDLVEIAAPLVSPEALYGNRERD